MTPAVSKSTLISLDEALRMSRAQNVELNRKHLNPRVTRLMRLLGADVPVVRAAGSCFWDANGRIFIDFLTGFGATSLGNNHPAVLSAVRRAEEGPAIIPGLNHLAAALAHNLVQLAPEGLTRVLFANSGTEVVEAAIKLSRAATGRTKLLACRNCFHGRTTGALALMDRGDFRDAFEPLLPGVSHVDFGDAAALEEAIRDKSVAGFFVEAVQGEGGILVPPPGYLKSAKEICERYGTLFVVDEVQAGLGRTGRLFAVDREGVRPDVLLLGKALGGGVAPISAILTSETIFRAAAGGTARSPFQTPTFGSNARSCAAGLATLEVLVDEHLAERAEHVGSYLLERLQMLQSKHPAIVAVRGQGLMIGIEFARPAGAVAKIAGWNGKARKGLLTKMVIMEMFMAHNVLTAYTLNNPSVLRLEPPLNIELDDVDYVVDALDSSLTTLAGPVRGIVHSCRTVVARTLTRAPAAH